MPKDTSFVCLGSALRLCVPALVLFLFLFVTGTQPARAQQPTTRNELWPEIDVYINVKPKVFTYSEPEISKDQPAFFQALGAVVSVLPPAAFVPSCAGWPMSVQAGICAVYYQQSMRIAGPEVRLKLRESRHLCDPCPIAQRKKRRALQFY